MRRQILSPQLPARLQLQQNRHQAVRPIHGLLPYAQLPTTATPKPPAVAGSPKNLPPEGPIRHLTSDRQRLSPQRGPVRYLTSRLPQSLRERTLSASDASRIMCCMICCIYMATEKLTVTVQGSSIRKLDRW